MKKVTIYFPDGKKQIITESRAKYITSSSEPPMFISVKDRKSGKTLADYIGLPFKVEYPLQ